MLSLSFSNMMTAVKPKRVRADWGEIHNSRNALLLVLSGFVNHLQCIE